MDVALNSAGEAYDEQGIGDSAAKNDRQQVEKIEPDAEDLQALSAVVCQGYDIDKNSLTTMTKSWSECKKLVAMLPEQQTRGGKFENAANVNLPIVLNAAIVFNARAYAAFFSSNSIVKCQVIGDDSGLFQVQIDPRTGQPMTDPTGQIQKQTIVPEGAKAKRASRISQHMSWQLTYQMPHWIEDMDKLLMLVPIYGSLFKKVYYNSYTKTNCSELILPQYLTVHAETRTLDTAPRITHSFGLYPYEIQERIGAGYFDEFIFTNDDSGEQHEFIEQHLRYDLDDDGYDEPLIVTVHSETKTVVRVEKRYIDEDVTYGKDSKGGGKKKIIRIEPENFFKKFGFMPNPTGGFYDIGIGYILYQISKAINTTVNQLLDAGTLANSPFFLLERGRMKGGEVKVRPGFGLFVNNDSRPLKDSIYQMTFGGPDAVLFQLLGFLFDYARNLGGMREVLEGGMRSDQTTGSTEMSIQEGMNEYKAIYKRLWRSMMHEYKRLFDLNHRYMDDKEYFKVLDSQDVMGDVQGKTEIYRTDYNADDFDVMPIADEEYLTSSQKKGKAMTAMKLAEGQLVNPKVAAKMVLQSENFDNIEELLAFEPTKQELELQKQKQDIEQAAVQVQGKEAQAAVIKETNALHKLAIENRKTDIAEATALFDIDKTKAEIIEILARAKKEAQGTDLEALDRISLAFQAENEKRITDNAALSASQGVPQQGGQNEQARVPNVAGNAPNPGNNGTMVGSPQ